MYKRQASSHPSRTLSMVGLSFALGWLILSFPDPGLAEVDHLKDTTDLTVVEGTGLAALEEGLDVVLALLLGF